MDPEILAILPGLRTMFRTPQLDKIPGGSVPRTSISDVLVDTFVKIVEVIRPPLVLEIGAHDASFSSTIKGLLPDSRVVAFEANPHVFSRYSNIARVRDSGIEYLLSAVSDVDGEVELIIPTSVAGTPKPLHNRMGSLNRLRNPTAEDETVAVPSVRLDSFLGNARDQALAMWIDVEGAVDKVLGGAKLVMPQAKAVICEVEDARLWKDQVTDSAIVAAFREWDLIPVLCDCQTRIQYNLILIKSALWENAEIRSLISAFPGKAENLLATIQ